jgi:hypothetical protein
MYVKTFFVSIRKFCDLLRWDRKGVPVGHRTGTDSTDAASARCWGCA